MNQPNFSMMTPKTAPVAESPDILALVRRYLWLLIAGAAVGTGASSGYYEYALRNKAEYTARIPFQVLPPPTLLGQSENSSQIVLNQDDTSSLVNRQKVIFEHDTFLKKILASEEFHPADKPGGKTPWLAENITDPLYYIKRDLRVEPRVNAATFEITFKSHDAAEAQRLLKAAAQEYMEYLRTQSKTRMNAYVKQMEEAVQKAGADFTLQSQTLAEYAKRMQIDVLKAGFEIQKNALQGLNDDFTKADAAAASVEAQLDTFNKRRDALRQSGNAVAPDASLNLSATRPASMTDLEIADVLLTLEMKQYIENDYNLRTLINTRLQWEQERVAELSKNNLDQTASTGAGPRTTLAGMTHLKEIDARLKEIAAQLETTRSKLKLDALERMEKTLKDESTSKRALAAYIGEIRKRKEDEVNILGQRLLEWDQRVADNKEQQESLNKMKGQLRLTQANQFTDNTRVQQMFDEPAVPNSPSWPKWYMIIPLGTFAGLGLSAMMAYLLFISDKRVRTPRDISRTLQLPTLGFVPDESDDRILTGEVETAILNSPSSMVAESFRQIRSQITAQTAHNPINTMVVSSVGPGGGASTVAANLAAAMALNGLRVLLVDANFYRPSLHRIFKGLPAEGLTDVIAAPQTLDTAVLPHPELSRLHLMGVGTKVQGASSELFESKSFRQVLDTLKSKYDLVLFDGAPLTLVSDSLSLASHVDGVISVVRAGEVSRGAVTRIRDQIRGVHGNLLGFILNAAKINTSGYYKENYRTFHRYAVKAGGK